MEEWHTCCKKDLVIILLLKIYGVGVDSNSNHAKIYRFKNMWRWLFYELQWEEIVEAFISCYWKLGLELAWWLKLCYKGLTKTNMGGVKMEDPDFSVVKINGADADI